MPGSVKTYIDFSGGFHSDTPIAYMGDADLAIAENCIWKDSMLCRKGYTKKHTFYGTIVGFIRAGISGQMLDYVVTKDIGGFALCIQNGTGFSILSLFGINAAETFVRMVEFSGAIVIVGAGGHSRPVVITYSNGVYSESSIEELDVRTREQYEWKAGRVNGSSMTDDTVDAQAGSWPLADGSGQGFYIASDLVFNRIEVSGITAPIDSALVKISSAEGWKTINPKVLSIAAGSMAIEFDLPFVGSDLSFVPAGAVGDPEGMYAVVVELSYSGANPSGVISGVKNTQYFRQITGNEFHTDATVYRSMLCLSAGNVVNFSQVDSLTGWMADDVEIFVEGGNGIKRMMNFKESLVVFKERAMYGFSGNSLNSPTVTRISDYGTNHPNSVVSMESEIMFVSNDKVMLYDGLSVACVSHHIASELRGKFASGAKAVLTEDGDYLVLGDSVGYLLKPSSLRQNASGLFLMSAFKYTNHAFSGAARRLDNGTLVAWAGGSFYALQDGTTDNGAPILMEIKTKDFDFGAPGVMKRYFRFKPMGFENAVEDSFFYIELLSDKAIQYAHRVDTSFFEQMRIGYYFTIPYEMDGYVLSVRMSTYAEAGAKMLGFALDMKGGKF